MLNPTSFIRLLITAAAVLPLIVTALPGVDPVNNRRGGAKLSSYHGNISTSTPILVRDASAGGACNTAADCGSDAPMCEFPWVFEPSPYNQPQRVCMLAINYQGCNSDSQCTTHNCITGADQPICFPDDGGCTANSCPQIPTTDMRCRYDYDCTGRGRCGKGSDVRNNGVSLEGFCLIAGNNPCTESAECSSGTCQANNFCAKDNVLGLPAPNDYTCGSDFRPTSFSYVASTELADGSFAISPIFYNYRYCGWNDQNAICSQNSECKSGLCLVSPYNDGEKRCGMGADIGQLCLRDADCHSQRCAHTKGVSHTSCTYQPVGGGCSMPSQCGSNKCTYSKCQAADVGGKCYYSSDCSTSNCSNGICGFLGATTTTTTATTATTTTASTASAPSTTDSTATSTSSSATTTSTSTTTLTSTGSTTTAASTSTSISTPTSSMSTSTSTSTTTTTTPKISTTTTSVSTASTSKPSSSTTSTTSKASGSSTGTTTTSKSSTSSTTSKSSTTSTSSKPISTTAPSTSIKPSTTTRSSTVISTSSTSKSTATASRSTTTTSKSTSTTSKSTITTSKSTITTSKSATTTSKPTTTTSVKPLPSGAPCSVNTICQSGYCRAKLNPDGTRASQAYCDIKKTGGAACYQNAGCLSGSCIIAKGASSGSCK